jgi:benzodiazapine receptor
MPLFFGFQRPIEATIDIVALLGTTSYLTYVWSQIDDVATYLMLPYIGWVSFATYLSVSNRVIPSWNFADRGVQAGCGYLNGWNFKKTRTGQPKQN